MPLKSMASLKSEASGFGPLHRPVRMPVAAPAGRLPRFFALGLAAAVLAGCAVSPPKQAQAPVGPECAAAAPDESLVGNWLSVRRISGVTGELRTLFSLRADGTMSYSEQLSRPRKAPQSLAETGCWHRDGKIIVLRTVESNGSPVDLEDPIYVNRYQLTSEGGERLGLHAPDGVKLDARRMPPDYRLPL